MVVLKDGEEIVAKKASHVQYDLWDEIVVVKSGDRVTGRMTLKDAPEKLCQALEIKDGVSLPSGKKVRLSCCLIHFGGSE